MRTGTRLGPYEIVAQIGAGGMGEVYRARDERLGRDVAIKMLPAAFASDADRLRRFEQEARATAALNHPNILAVYDVGTYEGSPYLVEELLEGESLRERLKGGPLPVRKALETAAQVARGLAAAHAKGVVHRDLKPENVFVTNDGTVKILDFGLAKLGFAGTGADLSTLPTGSVPHAVLGTVGYMAPEQVRGLGVDHRADLFAFGCLLYEMLAGKRAFGGESAADTMSAILTREPPELEESGARVSPAVDRIVRRCLEKRPEERFQSASDLAYDLGAVATDAEPRRSITPRASARRWRVAGLAFAGIVVLVAVGVVVSQLARRAPTEQVAEVPKIVVLPFENLGAAEDAYFASGMAEEITSRLANVHGLGVISRTTAVTYDRSGKTMKQIGADLGVDYVLEGSVRWDHGEGGESRVRITPQLIRVTDDTHVWADRYDRVLADVFAIQSDVAENTVEAMGFALLPREQSVLRGDSTNDPEAYDLYLRGLEANRRSDSRRDVEGALRFFQAAVDRDPSFASALAALSAQHVKMYWYHYDRSQGRIDRARELAERAVGLRPDLAKTHRALGWFYYQGLRNYPRALEEFGRALAIQPGDGDALFDIGAVVRRQGRWSEAADAFGKARDLDPRNPNIYNEFAESCILAGRYAEADRALAEAIGLNPAWGLPRATMALLSVSWRGDLDGARAALDEAGRVAGLTDDSGDVAAGMLWVAVARRDFPAALRGLEASTFEAIGNQFNYLPAGLIRGLVLRLAGQAGLARRAFETVRCDLERKVAQADDDHRLHASLAIAYAGLGRDDDAVREARRACELMPASRDAWSALYRLVDLAVVYTMTGRTGEAIATLDDLLGRSGEWTPHVLRLDPTWDPLRPDPRFQALLTKYAVKE